MMYLCIYNSCTCFHSFDMVCLLVSSHSGPNLCSCLFCYNALLENATAFSLRAMDSRPQEGVLYHCAGIL